MIEAVEGLVRDGEIGVACQIIPDLGSPTTETERDVKSRGGR
jgi:hypothetical protein